MSTPTNYFKCCDRPFFFDENDAASIMAAFHAAQMWQQAKVSLLTAPPRICVWQRPRLSGPWEVCLPIGETSAFL